MSERSRTTHFAIWLCRRISTQERAAELVSHLEEAEVQGHAASARDVGSISLLAIRNIPRALTSNATGALFSVPLAAVLAVPMFLVYFLHFPVFRTDAPLHHSVADIQRVLHIAGLLAAPIALLAARRMMKQLRSGRYGRPLFMLATVMALTALTFIEWIPWYTNGAFSWVEIRSLPTLSTLLFLTSASLPFAAFVPGPRPSQMPAP